MTRTALIVGAGIGGLAAGIALRQTAHLLGRGRRTARIIRTTNPVACSFREVAVRLAPVTLLVKLFASLNQRSGTDVSRGGRSA